MLQNKQKGNNHVWNFWNNSNQTFYPFNHHDLKEAKMPILMKKILIEVGKLVVVIIVEETLRKKIPKK